jgi:hypothetical protein
MSWLGKPSHLSRGRTASSDTCPLRFTARQGADRGAGEAQACALIHQVVFRPGLIFSLAAGLGFRSPARTAAPSDPGAAADPTTSATEEARMIWRIRIMLRKSVMLLAFASMVGWAYADHLSGAQVALGHFETRLGPIWLEHTTKNDLIKLYGPPSEEKTLPDDQDSSRGERLYFWNINGSKLGVRTWFQPKGESSIDSAEVWGTKALKWARTGKGLKIGDSEADLKRIYGRRFQSGRRKGDNILYIFIQWANGTEIHVDFSPQNKISHIQIAAPIE